MALTDNQAQQEAREREEQILAEQTRIGSEQAMNLQNLGPLQEIVMSVLMAFAKMIDPKLAENLGMSETLSEVMGFENTEQYSQYWEENLSPAAPEGAWRDNPPPSVDFDNAQELLRSNDLEVGARQEAVAQAIPQAAEAAGVSPEFMTGLWGVESSYGANRLSPSGCLGDFQFTQRTFRHVMQTYGDEIGEHMRANGQEELADQMEEDMQNDQTLLQMRDDPTISTYASAYYVKEVADQVGADPMNDQDWGTIYAGYNIGPGNAQKLDGSLANVDNVGAHLGSVASWNPMFFANGENGHEALENYRDKIASHVRDISPEEEPTQVASAEQALPDGIRHPEVADMDDQASVDQSDIPDGIRKPDAEPVTEGPRMSVASLIEPEGGIASSIQVGSAFAQAASNDPDMGTDPALEQERTLEQKQEQELAMQRQQPQAPSMGMNS